MVWVCYIIMIVVPYLLSGLNTSIIVCKLKTGKDIRTMGSGNAGLTNTLRTLGKGSAAIVLIGDVAKSALSILIVRLCFGFIGGVDTMHGETAWVEYMAGFMAIVGHCFPVYYGFKGGKGILTAISVIFMLDWRTALVLLAIFIVIVAATRYVSLGSICASACFCVFTFVFEALIDKSPSGVVNTLFAAFGGGLCVYRHRANIGRLLAHNEKKLGQKSDEGSR